MSRLDPSLGVTRSAITFLTGIVLVFFIWSLWGSSVDKHFKKAIKLIAADQLGEAGLVCAAWCREDPQWALDLRYWVTVGVLCERTHNPEGREYNFGKARSLGAKPNDIDGITTKCQHGGKS